MKTVKILVIISVFLFITGCLSISNIPYKGDTSSRQNNFRVIKTNVRGEDSGFALFCAIPFSSPSHADAMRDLHECYQGSQNQPKTRFKTIPLGG